MKIQKKKIYHVVFQTFSFIVDRYICFGNGSKEAELVFVKYLILEYKEFLLGHAHEINPNLYVYLIEILRELERYIDDCELLNIYHAVDLQRKTNILNVWERKFENGGFSESFDFKCYMDNKDNLMDKGSMFKSASLIVVKKLSNEIQCPTEIEEYLGELVRLLYFDEYDEDADNTELVELLQNIEEVKELEKMYHDSDIVTWGK